MAAGRSGGDHWQCDDRGGRNPRHTLGTSHTMRLLVVLALATGAWAQDSFVQEFVCPESYGDFPDAINCDYFWRCEKGVAKPMECEDGHAFDPRLRGTIYPCDYTFSVNCTGREQLQNPIPGTDPVCQRQNGIFPHEFECGKFYTCKEGLATESECATGLHLSLDSMECVWPEVANRGPCDTPAREGNFTCPPDAANALDALGNRAINPTYFHPTDCRFFYVCLNGINPELRGCPDSTVFNDATAQCDDPANVPGCENYYEPL
ncbi:protein obstructor-E-like [Amphibalanus amphitrite]|uniref:protein obstructor-E-like n=1 Tax=Amphibalanus amphitrite TaxID=1232801 RepID=UPI001C91CCAB|nr:protein obstructor-E-like [Amphibalanus amphitrite]